MSRSRGGSRRLRGAIVEIGPARKAACASFLLAWGVSVAQGQPLLVLDGELALATEPHDQKGQGLGATHLWPLREQGGAFGVASEPILIGYRGRRTHDMAILRCANGDAAIAFELGAERIVCVWRFPGFTVRPGSPSQQGRPTRMDEVATVVLSEAPDRRFGFHLTDAILLDRDGELHLLGSAYGNGPGGSRHFIFDAPMSGYDEERRAMLGSVIRSGASPRLVTTSNGLVLAARSEPVLTTAALPRPHPVTCATTADFREWSEPEVVGELYDYDLAAHNDFLWIMGVTVEGQVINPEPGQTPQRGRPKARLFKRHVDGGAWTEIPIDYPLAEDAFATSVQLVNHQDRLVLGVSNADRPDDGIRVMWLDDLIAGRPLPEPIQVPPAAVPGPNPEPQPDPPAPK